MHLVRIALPVQSPLEIEDATLVPTGIQDMACWMSLLRDPMTQRHWIEHAGEKVSEYQPLTDEQAQALLQRRVTLTDYQRPWQAEPSTAVKPDPRRGTGPFAYD